LKKRRRPEIAAASFASRAVVIAAGASGPARVDQWGGEDEAPSFVNVSYEVAGIEVTTYAARWSEDASAMLLDEREDVVGWWVENAYASTWEMRQPERKQRRSARKEAAKKAGHRTGPLPLDDSSVAATVVGDVEVWVAGFEMPADSIPISVLLHGGSTPIEALRLELVDDLLRYLDGTQAKAS
jgi:hypothetical protein